ncbi:hypothetical protein COUCH_32415 [Couchioplanes caeruleus]|uniref:hypothetical protein n=1 Tax=Couchioplanes caeruleus TaxID=56438 RepID=UPI0020C019A6|nr:hypothetical protein [Couchioplanes caeruleus]UQU63654.1 hypothetical protein COUCH_32415 [Couchioplanes caeruleus]
MNRIRQTSFVAAALVLLSACSSGSADQQPPEVATLESAPVTAAASRAAGTPKGVQLRLDMTDDEKARFWDAYGDCLFSHGVKERSKDKDAMAPAVGTGKRLLDPSGEPKAAYAACASQKPLEPVETDPDRNPNFAAQWQDNVRCLRDHGLMVHVTKPGEWTYDSSDTPVPDNQQQLERQCMLEAFGAKKD